MLGHTYHYYPGADGRRFCYAKHPTFLCPHGQLKISSADETWEVPEAFKRAAELLDVDPDNLVRLIVRGHHNNRRRRVAGKLTDLCDTCGHKMDRLGFRVWEEVESTRNDAGAQITRAMGGTPTTLVRTLYLATKKEAIEWAREEARISRSVAQAAS